MFLKSRMLCIKQDLDGLRLSIGMLPSEMLSVTVTFECITFKYGLAVLLTFDF